MKFLLSIFLCAAALAAVNAIVCLPNFCLNYKPEWCQPVEECDGRLEETGGGFCGCCPTCVQLTCKEEYDSKKAIEEPLLGMHLPECDDDGTYKPKQCIGSVCNCVTAEGKNIEGGTDIPIQDAGDVYCECARESYEATVGPPMMGAFIPTCDKYGDYQAVQCHGSVCYCVDNNHGNKVLGSEKHISEIHNMEC